MGLGPTCLCELWRGTEEGALLRRSLHQFGQSSLLFLGGVSLLIPWAHTVRAKARPKGATSCRRSIGGFRESGRWIGDNFMSRRNGEELSTSCWARTTFRAHNWSACKNLDICITILGWPLYWFGKMRNIFSSISIIVEGDFWTSLKKIFHCFETSTLEIKKNKQKRKSTHPSRNTTKQKRKHKGKSEDQATNLRTILKVKTHKKSHIWSNPKLESEVAKNPDGTKKSNLTEQPSFPISKMDADTFLPGWQSQNHNVKYVAIIQVVAIIHF